MNEKWKYIRTVAGFILWQDKGETLMDHKSMAQIVYKRTGNHPISAGFVMDDECGGFSQSLNMRALSEDTRLFKLSGLGG